MSTTDHQNEETPAVAGVSGSGSDGTRTRDLRRDRPDGCPTTHPKPAQTLGSVPIEGTPEDTPSDPAVHSECTPPIPVTFIASCAVHGLHGSRTTCFECGLPAAQISFVETRHAVRLAEQVDELRTELESARDHGVDLMGELDALRAELAAARTERDEAIVGDAQQATTDLGGRASAHEEGPDRLDRTQEQRREHVRDGVHHQNDEAGSSPRLHSSPAPPKTPSPVRSGAPQAEEAEEPIALDDVTAGDIVSDRPVALSDEQVRGLPGEFVEHFTRGCGR